MKYQIINYDNGRYMDEEGRWNGPEFDDALDALDHARSVVNEDLSSLKTDGMTADELYTQYTMFGTEPQIVSSGEEVFFSAWEYAKRRCEELCSSL